MTETISDLLTSDRGSFRDWLVERSPTLLAIFANLVVLTADFRVYDYLYVQTGSWWKALIGILGCAIPFFLWEIAWQYNHTTDGWRTGSLAMAGLAFVTSILIGVADYVGMIGAAWAGWLLGLVVVEIGVHAVVGLLYYYNDPDVARKRRKAQARARMLDQQLNAEEAEQILKDGRKILALLRNLEGQYSPEEVAHVIKLLNGQRERRDIRAPRADRGPSTRVPQGPYQPYQPNVHFTPDGGSSPGDGQRPQQQPQQQHTTPKKHKRFRPPIR